MDWKMIRQNVHRSVIWKANVPLCIGGVSTEQNAISNGFDLSRAASSTLWMSKSGQNYSETYVCSVLGLGNIAKFLDLLEGQK